MSRWLASLLVSFSFFFVWEMAQAKFFASMEGLPFWSATVQCLTAAGGDLLISSLAFCAAAVAARTLLWPARHNPAGLVVFLVVGLAISIAYEVRALQTGKWEYDESMPTVAGIGLLPLLQWLVIPLTQAGIFRYIWKSGNGVMG